MLTYIKNFMAKQWRWLIIITVSAIFFIGSAGFNYYSQSADFKKWLSPDESANYNFSKLYAQEKRLSFFEKYNLIASDVIHPRSYLSDNGIIKPISFLGIILIYGKIASLTSYKVLPYLTPVFAAIGLIFYFLLIKKIFGPTNGLISTLFLASFPPYIYYSARSFFHNTLFTVMLIISLFFATLISGKRKETGREKPKTKLDFLKDKGLIYAGLSGLFLGLTVMARASELIWLIPFWLIIWLMNINRVSFLKLVIFISFLLIAIWPAAHWNKALYGSYWQGGYSEMNQSILQITVASAALIKSAGVKYNVVKSSLAQIKANFFHFGFWPVKSLKMLYYYFSQMFYWLFWPALIGFLLFIVKIKKWQRRHYGYFGAYALACLVLLFYYGSWDFHDNPDPRSRTIGNSYTRYWLPIYLGAMPMASYFLIKFSNLFRKKIIINYFRAALIIILYFISLKFVLFGSSEGLVESAKKQLASRREFDKVLSLTEPRAVIITQYHDKLFFPERKVVVGLLNDSHLLPQ